MMPNLHQRSSVKYRTMVSVSRVFGIMIVSFFFVCFFLGSLDSNRKPDLLLLPHLVASTDVDIACHHGGNEGTSAIANTPAGSKVTFNWVYVGLFLFYSFTDVGSFCLLCLFLVARRYVTVIP